MSKQFPTIPKNKIMKAFMSSLVAQMFEINRENIAIDLFTTGFDTGSCFHQ